MIVIIIMGLFYSITDSQTINVKDHIKDKFPSIFCFYLYSLEDLDPYEKKFIDLLQNLPEEEQKYDAKEVYKNGFSLELLKSIKEEETIKVPTNTPSLPPLPKPKEKPIESLPSIIKRIEPSTVIVFTYDNKGNFLRLGSGFFIGQNGDIVTNYHTLKGASYVEVKTSYGKTHPMTYIVAEDEQGDLIRFSIDIPSQYVHPLPLSVALPEVGEKIIVYGSPLGLEKTVSDGIISAIREVPGYGKLIQITAPISPGSSGSPVLNMKGEIIGIATFQFIEGQNLNFAIPSEKIVSLILTEEKKKPITEELFEQEEKGKKDSDYAYEVYDKALHFIDKKEYEKALPYLEIAIKTDITSLKAWAYFQMGFCYGELKSSVKAMEAFKQAIRIDPDYALAHVNLGIAYGELGNYAKAMEAFKQAISIDPVNANAHLGVGNAYYEFGLYKDAIEAYKQVIRIDPDDAITYGNLGAAYLQLGFYKDAIETCKQAIRIDPDYALAHVNLGIAYGKLGNHTKKIEALKQAIRIDTDDGDAHYNLGITYGKLGNHTKAIGSFKQTIRIDTDYANAHLGLGIAYHLIGDSNSALNEYKILKELDIDKANKLFDLLIKKNLNK